MDITECPLTLILNKIVMVLQGMKNGTLCDVSYESNYVSVLDMYRIICMNYLACILLTPAWKQKEMQPRSQRVADETLTGNKVQTIMIETTDTCKSFIYSTLTNRVKF